MKRLIVLVALVAVLFPSTVLAIADPDSEPDILNVYVYEDCMETGDIGVLVDFNIEYAISPTVADPNDTVTNAYLVVFVDTDGTTQLRAVSPYTYQDSGYGRNLAWIYFTAAEVTTLSIDVADEALYRVWLTGNPTLPSGWTGDPPKVVGTIGYWQTSGVTATLLAQLVRTYADSLELIWGGGVDLIEATAIGNRLTVDGEELFTNIIPNLRTIAPAAFADATIDPTDANPDYSTSFGAIATGAVIPGSPFACVSGNNAIGGLGAGTFTLDLNPGTTGTVTGATVVGTPVTLVSGRSTITLTGAGPIVIAVALTDLQSHIVDDTLTGTGFDLTVIATHFGMSTMLFSSMVWLIITILICVAVMKVTSGGIGSESFSGASGKILMLVFNLSVIGGAVIGLLNLIVAILLFIGFTIFMGYILFFRGASI